MQVILELGGGEGSVWAWERGILGQAVRLYVTGMRGDIREGGCGGDIQGV